MDIDITRDQKVGSLLHDMHHVVKAIIRVETVQEVAIAAAGDVVVCQFCMHVLHACHQC